jgi:hypothetical protein
MSEAIGMLPSATHLRAVVNLDGAAVFDPERGELSNLNPTGAYVWEGLRQGKHLETIIEQLARDTGSDPTIVDREVRSFLEELKAKHLMPR